MRIAFVVWSFPALSETFILNQITGLIDRGHEVNIYARDSGNSSKVHPNVEKYRLLDRTYYYGEIPKNRRLRLLKGVGLLWSNFYKNPLVLLRSLNVYKYGQSAFSLRLLYAIIPFLGRKPYDIIHCQFGELGLNCMLFRSIGLSQAKLVTSFRGYDISEYVKRSGDEVYNQLFELGDFFLPNCDYFKHLLLKLGCDEGKLAVLRSGIDCDRFTFTPRYPPCEGSIRIVTISRLAEKKGIEYGIRAIARLAKANRNIKYDIVGDGLLRKKLQQLIQELDVNDAIKLLGWKQQPEVIEILNRSHIFLSPNVTAKDGNQDGPPNVLKEAIAMGLPVLSTKVGAISEVVKDGISGFLVPERDIEALTEKLENLLDCPENWSEMGSAGRSYIEAHYDINELNEQLLEIYDKVLV
ncbi:MULTISPECIES: glycosyltransferase [unclassified Coleofasciculus]|uniref:glycosyltransferase n=1 Tax=unclassified Coleofasciculus TaxID=2692782 RepID=UPI00187F27E7|nr:MULTISPECIES: glycosyltransferase [unclassified Coleofasciculus]MBE9129028.1 glycosyltransferase [Coleofasciculus sp. LEGE 07081]MBE9147467.1 glycosyltransferase [Coleofasciculus sp. LEGE 07092]